MFSPFARDLLQPEFSPIFENLMRRPISGNHILDIVPHPGSFMRHDCNLKGCRNMFQLFLNVKQFRLEEIEVKIVGDFIVVHAKHDEVLEGLGMVRREFSRRYKIPTDIDPTTVMYVLNSNGVLLIKAPKKIPELAADEIIVPIEIQRPPTVDSMAHRSAEQPVQVLHNSVETPTNQ